MAENFYNKDMYDLGEMKFSKANRRSTECNGVSSMSGDIGNRRNGFRSK